MNQPNTPADESRGTFDPSTSIHSGRADARNVLVLWCLRKSFYPVLWLGFIIAALSVRDANLLTEVGQVGVGESVSALMSPLAGIVLALGLRILVNLLALVATYPLVRSTSRVDYSSRRAPAGLFGLWRDRIYLARGLRALRWSGTVRKAAAERLGTSGRALAMCGNAMTWAGPAMLLGAILVSAVALK